MQLCAAAEQEGSLPSTRVPRVPQHAWKRTRTLGSNPAKL
jgi:hypothetical protein